MRPTGHAPQRIHVGEQLDIGSLATDLGLVLVSQMAIGHLSSRAS
ncbi:MAG: hypothetical protein WAL25_06980 [Acidimicrobiia bacterium]